MPGVIKHADDSGHESGTHRPETAERCWGRQARVASGMYWRRYGQHNEVLLQGLYVRVAEANAAHLKMIESRFEGRKCPWALGCAVLHASKNKTALL